MAPIEIHNRAELLNTAVNDSELVKHYSTMITQVRIVTPRPLKHCGAFARRADVIHSGVGWWGAEAPQFGVQSVLCPAFSIPGMICLMLSLHFNLSSLLVSWERRGGGAGSTRALA